MYLWKKKFSFKRSLTSYTKVQRLIGALVRNRSFQLAKSDVVGRELLNLGCGWQTHELFINLDSSWHPKLDVCWDIERGLPFRTDTIAGIFTEHCLEHLPLVSIYSVLRECLRVLRPGGVLRIVVPDGELYLRRYVALSEEGTHEHMPYSENDGFMGLYSPIMSVNRIFREHGHQFILDFETLRQLLSACGYSEIRRESLGAGRDERLLIDTESRAIESLYVEAAKP